LCAQFFEVELADTFTDAVPEHEVEKRPPTLSVRNGDGRPSLVRSLLSGDGSHYKGDVCEYVIKITPLGVDDPLYLVELLGTEFLLFEPIQNSPTGFWMALQNAKLFFVGKERG
jgi:hypothetical protein